MSDFYHSNHIRKTRRERPCCWCGEQIPKGSEAWSIRGSRDGDFWADHMHEECMQAQRRCTMREHYELLDGWEFGEFCRGMTPGEAAAERRGES